ncbi:hypothetical protein, partial [Actinomadura rubrisoli]
MPDAAELRVLLGMVSGEVVTIGHGRDDASRAAAGMFAEAWERRGGVVLDVVGWPEEAASWLRFARRFAAGPPDAWIVAARPAGWARMARRLRQSTDWAPERTYGFASAGSAEAVALAGRGTLEGMRGATADGGTWVAGDGWVRSW